jgi:hypothetical protein
MTGPIVQHSIESRVDVRAPAESVWQAVTDVDIASFHHPLYLRALGVPKPLSANVVKPGVGGARVAHFSNGLRFSQQITEWSPCASYAFTFRADPGFRVGWLLDLGGGPFRLRSGAYRLAPHASGIELTLTTHYDLSGFLGSILRLPAAIVLFLFQRYLLAGIRKNAERPFAEAEPPGDA